MELDQSPLPSLLADKSALQRLKQADRELLHQHYRLVVPYLLVTEIVADLIQPSDDGRLQRTGTKTGGPDFVVKMFRSFNLNEPISIPPPPFQLVIREVMNAVYGQPQPVHLGVPGPDPEPDVSIGVVETIREFQDGTANPIHEYFAKDWREMAQEPFEQYRAVFWERHVILPRARNLEEAKRFAVDLVDGHTIRPLLIQIFLEHCGARQIPPLLYQHVNPICHRPWSTWAPYTRFCLVCLITGTIAWRDQLLSQSPNNAIDLQYLYLLPFCDVFSSADKLHTRLVPLFLRNDQRDVLPEALMPRTC